MSWAGGWKGGCIIPVQCNGNCCPVNSAVSMTWEGDRDASRQD